MYGTESGVPTEVRSLQTFNLFIFLNLREIELTAEGKSALKWLLDCDVW